MKKKKFRIFFQKIFRVGVCWFFTPVCKGIPPSPHLDHQLGTPTPWTIGWGDPPPDQTSGGKFWNRCGQTHKIKTLPSHTPCVGGNNEFFSSTLRPSFSCEHSLIFIEETHSEMRSLSRSIHVNTFIEANETCYLVNHSRGSCRAV